MHELSIAQNIIEIVENYAIKANATIVTDVEVDVGTISGIIPDTLEFVWELAVKNTITEKAKLKINVITAKARCHDCKTEFDLEDVYSVCPSCNSNHIEIYQGKELLVRTIKIESDNPVT